MAKPYLNAFNDINSGWMKVQNSLIAGQGHIKQNFAKMGLDLVQNVAGNFEKMLADQVRFEIRKVMMHRASMLQQRATDATGTAAAVGIAKTQEAATGLSAAKTAFKNTYATVSGWPVVGPVLAPILAPAAFAAVAAFEQGGIVGGSSGMGVPILAHAGERVLTTSQTSKFESMVNSSTSSGGPVSIRMGDNHFNGQQGGNVISQLQQSHRQFRRLVESMHKDKPFNFA